MIDVAPGLWIWRLEHPDWTPEEDWQQVVTCVCVDAGGERWLLDPLMPPDNATEVWRRLDEQPPTAAAILIPDHLRGTWDDRRRKSIDDLVERYACRAFGPQEFDADDEPPLTKLEPIIPGRPLPGGLVPFRAPRGWDETPLWCPEQRALIVGDTLTERDGVLRVWGSPTHFERALPDLRRMLELPIEWIVISHGEPIHTRDELVRALDLPPWPAGPLHYAAYRGDMDLVRRLVDAGSDLLALDERYGMTPLGWAETGNHEDVVAYLREVTA